MYLNYDGDVDNVVLFFGSVNNVEDGDVDNVGNIVEVDVDEVPGSAGGDVDDIGNIVEGDVVDLPGGAGGDPGGEEREQVVDGVRGERQRDRRHLARLLVPAVRFALNKLYKSVKHFTLYSKSKEKYQVQKMRSPHPPSRLAIRGECMERRNLANILTEQYSLYKLNSC